MWAARELTLRKMDKGCPGVGLHCGGQVARSGIRYVANP